MTVQHNKPKRWRPRFSVRTLVIVVTLVCCYAACWEPTKRQGVKTVVALVNSERNNMGIHESVSLPLVVSIDETKDSGTADDPWVLKRRYYFWFFGLVARLPFERDVTPDQFFVVEEIRIVSFPNWYYVVPLCLLAVGAVVVVLLLRGRRRSVRAGRRVAACQAQD